MKLKDILLSSPNTELDHSLFPKIRDWSDSPTALEILNVLDYCVHGGLAGSLVMMLLDIEFKAACEHENVTPQEVYDKAEWRKN